MVGTRLRARPKLPPGDDARDWSRPEYVERLLGGQFDLQFEAGEWHVQAESAEALWRMLAESVPPLKAWLLNLDAAGRRHAERIYLEFLEGGKLRRNFVLIQGSRR